MDDSAPAKGLVLGVLSQVDLRSLWLSEPRSFTPWLADNLDYLSRILGMDLELLGTEVPVGTFKLDILAHDTGRDRVVVIENQLTTTNHDHLGKLLTYAAGLEAGVAVWIATLFRDEHRQALDWLNQRSNSDTAFFGLEVEAVRIDNSNPAVNFKIVSSPNEWQKVVSRSAGELTPREQGYQRFFERLLEDLRRRHFTNAKAFTTANWYSFASGLRGVTYAIAFTTKERMRAEVYLGDSDAELNKRVFDELFRAKDEIEHEYGARLEWESLDNRNSCRIAIYTSAGILDPKLNIEELVAWSVQNLEALRRVFNPRIATLL